MEKNEGDTLMFYCNGIQILETNPDPEMSLLTYIRTELGLAGTKRACDEGGCGACTLMVSTHDRASTKTTHQAVNACLTPLCSVHGAAVTTVEGIGSTKTKMHPVQERIAKAHGSQCGFCTPGMVMSMYTLLRNNPEPTVEEIRGALAGNLCRCTGYRSILAGFQTFCKKDGCCGGKCQDPQQSDDAQDSKRAVLFNPREFAKYDPSQDLIFPPALMLSLDEISKKVVFRGKHVTWYRPLTLEDVLTLKAEFPDAKLINGNTAIGLETRFKYRSFPVLVDVRYVTELRAVEVTADGVVVGASVTLSRLEDVMKDVIQQQPEHATRLYTAISTMLRRFGSTQIRNVVAVGSCIVTAGTTSDLIPILLAAGSTLEVVSKSAGSRTVKLDETFISQGVANILRPDDVIRSVTLPATREHEHIMTFKQSHRREFDSAIVNACMRVVFEADSDIVRDVALVFGGVAPKAVVASETMATLRGKIWDNNLLEVALKTLESLPSGAPGGMDSYRKSLALGFFFKFYLAVLEQRSINKHLNSAGSISSQERSALNVFPEDQPSATQFFQGVPADQQPHDPVGRPMRHKSADHHATGEAVYVSDMPAHKDTLYMSLVYGRRAHAKIKSVDPSRALAQEGVRYFVSAEDVPGENTIGAIEPDGEVFATKEIFHACQAIGGILADTQTAARKAAQLVEIEYEELESIITLEDAIERLSFLDYSEVIERGDLAKGFEKSDYVIEGEARTGAQEHFYFETQSAIAVPKGEDGEMEVFVSTQGLDSTHSQIASVLGVPRNRVTCRVKRLGGAFGGKESMASRNACYCAVAANRSGRPVRLVLDRDEDMMSTGARDPFLGRYRLGCTRDGKILAADIRLYSNAGFSLDLSGAVTRFAMQAIDSAYFFPATRVEGFVCRTNTKSNTAFRGFGTPQAMFITESMLTEVGVRCDISQQQVREINMYQSGDVTPTNQTLHNCTVRDCWDLCLEKSHFAARRRAVDSFNRDNRWKKRGLGTVAVKYGIGFYEPIKSNQGCALVHIYTDGSVLVSTGGVEMGQGLFTKLQQIAARALGIPATRIYQAESATDKVPNAITTAGSTGTDLNGGAVQAACETLLGRLKPYMEANESGGWDAWVGQAYCERMCLSTVGFYKTPGLTYDVTKNEGRIFAYYTYGAGLTEVEIDCLTGAHRILRTDIVMDVGKSINPAIDVGQIEGAYMQGYGLFVQEDLRWSRDGHLLTRGPGTYKIPSFGDIPAEFNVTLLPSSNPKGICSSKGIGEPPLFIGASVFFAIKDAISSARADEGLTGAFRLDSPAVPERIRLACVDRFTKMSAKGENGNIQPPFVRV